MMRLTLCFLFLSCVFCLATGQQGTVYSRLEPRMKSIVDLAVNEANQKLPYGHLNFYDFTGVAELTPRVRIQMRFKNTLCRKGSRAQVFKQRPECLFLQVEVHCFVCSSDPNTNSPFIDCARRQDERVRFDDWDKNCPV